MFGPRLKADFGLRCGLFALLCILLAAAAAGAAPAALRRQVERIASCPAVEVLGSRGSGDTLGKDHGLGAPGYAFEQKLAQLVRGVEPWPNPYAAVGVFSWNLRKLAPQLINGIGAGTKLSGLGLGAYHDSVVGGERDLSGKLVQLARECSGRTAVVLVGYSQGAQVTADVVQRDLTAPEKAMLAAVVLFGDPYFNHTDRAVDRGSFSGRRGGILGQRPKFAPRPLALSYCHSHDPICQGIGERIGPVPVIDPGSLTFKQHTNYTSFGEPEQAAEQVAKLPALRPASSHQLALQACVDRFNWMHMAGWYGGPGPTPTKVRASPCQVTISYTLATTGQAGSPFSFPCALNKYGAYVCASHASGEPNGPILTGWNARYYAKSGVLRLDAPPARHPPTPKPAFVARYPVDHGYIVPFDAQGRLRPGLTLLPEKWDNHCPAFANDPIPKTTLLGCSASSVCFLPTLQPEYTGEVVACAEEPGSRVFYRNTLTVSP